MSVLAEFDKFFSEMKVKGVLKRDQIFLQLHRVSVLIREDSGPVKIRLVLKLFFIPLRRSSEFCFLSKSYGTVKLNK